MQSNDEIMLAKLQHIEKTTDANSKLTRALYNAVMEKLSIPVRCVVSQQQAVELIANACDMRQLPKSCAFSLKTLQRMERGRAPSRSGYDAAVRLNRRAFFAWLQAYIADESTRLDRNRAVSYSEALLEHQGNEASPNS